MRIYLHKFWEWYERHKTLNLGIAAGLFAIQLIHLFWLTTNVVFLRLWGVSYFSPTGIYETIIVLVDYTEIPALITTSLVYVNQLRKKFSYKPVWFLLFLNSQWIHIFWITDEFVVERFTGVEQATSLPIWIAWLAILVDYLELPVIFDTTKEFVAELKKGKIEEAVKTLKES